MALLEDPRVTVELVTDGLHVHPALWEHVLRAAGAGRVAAVTGNSPAATCIATAARAAASPLGASTMRREPMVLITRPE